MHRNRLVAPLALLLACSTASPGPDDATAKSPPAKSDAPPSKPPPLSAPSPEPDPTPIAQVDPDMPAATTSADDIKQVARSLDAFALDLYPIVARSPGNLIVSPASIAIALGMTGQGARGSSQKELDALLHVADSGLPPERFHAALGGIATSWNALAERPRQEWMPAIEVSVVDRLFGDKSTQFHTAFLDLTARTYRAPLEQVDFVHDHGAARQRINGWVADKTHDKIRDLIPDGGVNAATRLVLTNAIYFEAQWIDPFNESATRPRPFFVDGKTSANVPTMEVTAYVRHGGSDADGVSIVEMGYEGGPFAMDILLPTDRAGLARVEAGLGKLDAWLAATSTKRVTVAMPKFRVEPPESMRLGPALGELGVVDAFDPGKADFTGMAPAAEQITLTEVFHKGFVEVDEKGTVAAAATAVAMRAGSAPPSEQPIAFTVDRPFLFLIRDTETGAIAFMGRVTDPSSVPG